MSATTFLRRRNYAGDTCKNEEFPAATFGKTVCIFRYLGVAKNSFRNSLNDRQRIEFNQIMDEVNCIDSQYAYECFRAGVRAIRSFDN